MSRLPPRILIVEDETLIALLLEDFLLDIGAEIAGIAGTVDDALALMASLDRIDAATVDLQLGHQPSWPVATALQARDVPILFTTGAPDVTLPPAFANSPRLGKPFTSASLRAALAPLVSLPETNAPGA